MSEIHNEVRALAHTLGGKTTLKVIDVGGWNFSDSITIKRSLPHAQVVCFEPADANLTNYGTNAIRHGIHVVPLAVSDENSETVFFPSVTWKGRPWSASGSLMKPVVKAGTEEGVQHESLMYDLKGYEVKTIRLDTYCDLNRFEPIDYLRVDVQGGEHKVMRGLGALRPALIFAETCEFDTYETGMTLEGFDQLMRSMGYEIVKRFRDDTLYKHALTLPNFAGIEWQPKLQ